MNTKIKLILIAILGLSIAFTIYFTTQKQILPAPTNGNTIAEEGDNQAKREAWFELMHQAAPGTNWRALEYQTQMKRHQERVALRQNAASRDNEEILADGQLVGEWKERGSRNQAGSVHVTLFDPLTEFIFLISDGGTLWRGTLQGEFWEPINQDLRFNKQLLKFIPTYTGRRMIAVVGEIPHYSDDDGYTWTASTGIPINNSGARSRKAVVLDNNENAIYLLSKAGSWDDYALYQSLNKGETYQMIHQFNTPDHHRYAICNPHHSNEVYIIEKINASFTKLYQINQDTAQLDLLVSNETFGFGHNDARVNLIGVETDTSTRLLIYDTNNQLYTTEDFGATWELKGQLPTRPWSVGIYMLPSNPDFLIYGEVECYFSGNSGALWGKVNDWGAYYGDIMNNLHADLMHFNEFQTSAGDPFILISNHGGLSISYDQMETRSNLGLAGLNVSQYYDVKTDPIEPEFMYTGSQDQGYQRAYAFSLNALLNFDQLQSGDYGYITFSDEGKRLWTDYVSGLVFYSNLPRLGSFTSSWELESQNEHGWLAPMFPGPNQNANEIYFAGGNANGGSGSHLIKLTHQSGEIIPDQLPFDFYAASNGGLVSAMSFSPDNPIHWFAATTNGRFFYSVDAGQTWEQSFSNFQNLYGTSILPSKFEENTVYFAGSGYSNPAIWKSTDGGETFLSLAAGLPPTLVNDIAADAEESMLFAATDAGPYVFIVDDQQWYDMSGEAAPSQAYMAVEFVEEDEVVRFATYGRGVWDFQISSAVGIKDIAAENKALNVFPNPSTDLIHIQLDKPTSDLLILQLLDINGKVLKNERFELTGEDLNTDWSIGTYAKGTYIITVKDENRTLSQQVILQ